MSEVVKYSGNDCKGFLKHSLGKAWQHDREFLDNEKFLETKAALQRIQIEHDLDNNLDALVMFLVVKGVI